MIPDDILNHQTNRADQHRQKGDRNEEVDSGQTAELDDEIVDVFRGCSESHFGLHFCNIQNVSNNNGTFVGCRYFEKEKWHFH